MAKKGALKRDDLRGIGGSIVRSLHRAELCSAELQLDLTIPRGVANEHEIGHLVGEGMTIANWRVDQFDGAATKRKKKIGVLSLTSGSKEGCSRAKAWSYSWQCR